MTKHLRSGTQHLLCCLVFLSLFGFISACESTLMREFNHHMSGNDLQNAQGVVQQELSRNGQDPEANYLMGNLLSRQQQYAEANTYFGRSLSRSSVYREHIEFLKERSFRLEFNDGVEAYRAGRHERAVRQFELALQIYPENTEVHPLLAKSRLELGQHGEAKNTYRTCLEHKPSNLECGLNFAELLLANEEYEEAIEVAELISSHHPQDWRPKRLLTDAYLNSGNYDEAETAFGSLSNLNNHYNHLKQFALSLYNDGQVRRSEPYLVDYLNRNPNDADVLQVLAGIYLDSGNYELVIEAGNRILNQDPQNNAIKAKMLIAYELTGDLDRHKKLQEELGINE